MGSVAGAELAGAVSATGALGTVGILPPAMFQNELGQARERAAGRPVAANLLVPFTKQAHVDACLSTNLPVVVLHGGFDRDLVSRLREGGIMVFQTVGTEAEARRALADGAQGLIAQGRDAGGHLVGVESPLTVLERIQALAGSSPVLVAGGIADAADSRRALDAGAEAVVAGTRFLLTDECMAHPAYKQRVLDADRTLETLLFGLGWPMRHRVVPNAATERWCRRSSWGPRPIVALESLTGALGRLPMSVAERMAKTQRPAIPLFGPAPPTVGMPERLVDSCPLYAGETALRIEAVVPAATAVEYLAPQR